MLWDTIQQLQSRDVALIVEPRCSTAHNDDTMT